MKHKAIVAEIACGAPSQGKTAILGVLFDEVTRLLTVCVHVSVALRICVASRKHWEDESGKKGDRFTVEDVVGKDQDMLLKRATVLYDTLFWKAKGQSEVEYVVYSHCDLCIVYLVCLTGEVGHTLEA